VAPEGPRYHGVGLELFGHEPCRVTLSSFCRQVEEIAQAEKLAFGVPFEEGLERQIGARRRGGAEV
jgi:hypothetical protein